MHEPPTTWIEVSRAGVRKTAEEHALVLEALGIPSGTATAGAETVVLVRLEDAGRARSEIEKFVGENRGWPPLPEASPSIWPGVPAAAAYAAVLLLVDMARRRGSLGFDWGRAGAADAVLIRGGAWWRSVTALCLHADSSHLLGNLLFGALFVVMFAQSVGFGLAALAAVLTGGLGNWLDAWLQLPPHTSVGASTAVFGLLGAQVAFDGIRRREAPYGLVRRLAPVVMGVVLLAWLGGGGDRSDPRGAPSIAEDFNVPAPKIDVLAHVLGFAAGALLGSALRLRRPWIVPAERTQVALAGAALGVVAVSWVLAFR